MSATPDEPRRARRPVRDREGPEDTSGRRGCLIVGGLLGIVAGALLAFFVLPPLINYYFGTADVKAGKAYTADAKVIRVTRVEARPTTTRPGGPVQFAVRLSALTNKTWHPEVEDFELELSDGEHLTLLPPDEAEPATSLDFDLGEERSLLLRFAPVVTAARPKTLHMKEPRVRFALPGAAGE
ncbi:MAG: hypothetical protein IT304_07245 [Dehalococcoidia bacterium]|nr:hypothetical protein [Dehalococcoidia bacterium]